jgi:hypothetical protein
MSLTRILIVTGILALIVAGYCHAAVKVSVVTHRTTTIEDGTTNYTWRYEASFYDGRIPGMDNKYASSVDSGTNATLTAELKAQIAANVADYFKLQPADVAVTP